MKQAHKNEITNPKTRRARQIGALICAILDFEGSDQLFAACLMATIGLPILLWIYIWVYGKYTGKHTLADAPEAEKPDQKSF